MSTLKTIKETGLILNCKPVTVRRLIKAGKINYKKINTRYLFTDDQIAEYLQSVDVTQTADNAGGKK